MSSDASTPLMRQYHAIKEKVPGALLFFRLGDFYELFFGDALVASRELQITLTSRNKEKGNSVPMCGVPYHSADRYISKLVDKGYRVAICDQAEDPKLAKKLVRREITRVVSPGTAGADSNADSSCSYYLFSVCFGSTYAGVAFADVSTGEFRASQVPAAELPDFLESLRPRELLVSRSGSAKLARVLLSPVPVTELEDWLFDHEFASRTLREHYQIASLDGLGLSNALEGISAAGALLHQLRETQRSSLAHLDPPTLFSRSEFLVLDEASIRNLELLDSLNPAEGASLRAAIDITSSGLGSRLLRRWLVAPLLSRTLIEERLDSVEFLLRDSILRGEVALRLGAVLDIERLLARAILGTANARDLLSLGRSLAVAEPVAALFSSEAPTRLAALRSDLLSAPGVSARILETLADDPPVALADGGTIRPGVHPALDEFRDLLTNGRSLIARIEERERVRTGIGSLKVRFNNVFGYYIEISRSNLASVPPDYERKQTVANAERFTTPELKRHEVAVLEAEERVLDLERSLIEELRLFVGDQASHIRTVASAFAEVDILAAFAELAARHTYVRPRFNEDGDLAIVAGRHPVVEQILSKQGVQFVSNDLFLDPTKRRLAIVTGPNMGGKSTYLRQTALIAVLAQIGSFVPADSANLPLFDRIFTRIGASDNLARGRSTFMVEMTETAAILNSATHRSLVLLDEIGRGTATYDGLALAWSVMEHLYHSVRAKTLFATHYHELTAVADRLDGIENLQVLVRESGDRILFLHSVAPGRADRSYGIEVARLAGLPPSVIERAREVLLLHEAGESKTASELAPVSHPQGQPVQIKLFEPVGYQLADRIRSLRIDELRPIDAIKLLSDLQQDLRSQ